MSFAHLSDIFLAASRPPKPKAIATATAIEPSVNANARLTILSARPIAFKPIASTSPKIAKRAIFASPLFPSLESLLCAMVLKKFPTSKIMPPINIPPPNSSIFAKIVEIISMPRVLTAAVEAVSIEKNIIAPLIKLIGVNVFVKTLFKPIFAGSSLIFADSSRPESINTTNLATK